MFRPETFTEPTRPLTDSSNAVATTAFVQAILANVTNAAPSVVNPTMDGVASPGVSLSYARADHIHPTDTSRAPLVSPSFTGTVTSAGPITISNATASTSTITGALTVTGGVGVAGGAFIGGLVDVTTGTRTGATLTPNVNINLPSETMAAGAGFFINTAITSTRTGGTGHRETLHVEALSSATGYTEFSCAGTFIGHTTAGTGQVFGLNAYSWVDAGALATTNACAFEANTDIRRTVERKVGIQVVDVATSTTSGTLFDAGIIIGRQPGGVGYNVGLQFGFDGTTGFMGFAGSTLIYCPSTAISLTSGINFEGVATFSTAAIILPPNNKGIYWGSAKAGGAIVSETATNGGNISFTSGATLVRNNGNTTIANFGAGSGASGQTYLTFWDGASYFLRRIICGAVDSAGAGYRTVKVENS